jgi:arylsulfatase A-like enzyme
MLLVGWLLACGTEPASLARPALPSVPAVSPAPPTPGAPATPAVERPNFLVVDIDSLRADRLDAEVDGQAVMPNVRRLMERGTTFTHAIAQSGWTVPGLTSILTGRWPVAVNVGAEATPLLPKDARLFPEILSLYGYETTGVWGKGVESGFAELSRGFTTRLARDGALGQTADDLAAYAPWLTTNRREPFLLFLHEFDAHVPGPWFSAAHGHSLGSEGYTCPDGDLRPVFEGLLAQGVSREAAMAHALRHYDGVLHGYDALLGALLGRMDAAGLLAHTVVIVTSNHGEDFGEHGAGIKHGALYDTTLRVPFVVAGPGIRRGARIDLPVQGIDLSPTVLALAHVPAEREVNGVSLATILAGEAPAAALLDRPAFVFTNERNVAVRTPTRKLLLTDEPLEPDGPPPMPPGPPPSTGTPPPPGATPDAQGRRLPTAERAGVSRYELYDLVADPREQTDLYAPGAAADLLDALEAFRDARVAEGAASDTTRVDDTLRRDVQAHGYWEVAGGGATPPPARGAGQ